jgi:hypothetical protein
MRARRCVAMVVCVAVVSACASPGSRPSHVATTTPATDPIASLRAQKIGGVTWHAAPAKAGEIVYSGAGIRTMPAPPNAKPAFTQTQVQAAAINHAMVHVGSMVPQMTLRMVQNGDFAGSTLSTPQLEWVVEYPNTPDVGFGGPADAGPAPSGVPETCSYTMFFDAMTGAALGSFQTCTP